MRNASKPFMDHCAVERFLYSYLRTCLSPSLWQLQSRHSCSEGFRGLPISEGSCSDFVEGDVPNTWPKRKYFSSFVLP